MFPRSVFAIVAAILFLGYEAELTEAITCFSCQYSENPALIGYECVTSPPDYVLGPITTECEEGCQIEIQSINGWLSVWFAYRGCKTKVDSCPEGGNICVETCTSGDLCNDKVYQMSTFSTTPAPITTTTTEAPGTRSCYSCLYSYHPEGDDTCVTDPASVPPPSQVRCPPERVCYTFSQWDKGEGVVRSFARGCEFQQGRPDECIEDTFFVTCNSFCTTEFCNSAPYPLLGEK